MKKFNTSEFIWFLILFMFTLYIYFLISKGKMNLYIHPKMIKYSAFSFVVLGELTIVQAFKIFSIKTRNRFKNGYILFLMALILGIFFAPGGLNSDISRKKGVTFVSSRSIENIATHSHEEGEVIEGNEIIFSEKNYIHYLEDLGKNLNKHIGKRVKIKGFILKNSSLNDNEFVVTRMLINCCAADSQVLGIRAKWDKSEELTEDQWVIVEGIISSENNNAVILVESVNKIEKPSNPYIYE